MKTVQKAEKKGKTAENEYREQASSDARDLAALGRVARSLGSMIEAAINDMDPDLVESCERAKELAEQLEDLAEGMAEALATPSRAAKGKMARMKIDRDAYELLRGYAKKTGRTTAEALDHLVTSCFAKGGSHE